MHLVMGKHFLKGALGTVPPSQGRSHSFGPHEAKSAHPGLETQAAILITLTEIPALTHLVWQASWSQLRDFIRLSLEP